MQNEYNNPPEPGHQGQDHEGPVQAALSHLRTAEETLHHIHHDERRAETELQKAERELEDALNEQVKDTEIFVNGRPRRVKGNHVSFEQVVALAYPNGAPHPDTIYSMTYKRAAQVPHEGELCAGGVVKIKEGTIFNVTETVKS